MNEATEATASTEAAPENVAAVANATLDADDHGVCTDGTSTSPTSDVAAKRSRSEPDHTPVSDNAGRRAFDVSLAARHEYLGDVDYLDACDSSADVADDDVVRLPFLPLAGIVLVPGDELPLKLIRTGDIAIVEAALTAQPPLRRLVAVTHMSDGLHLRGIQFCLIGCAAEIRRLRRLPHGEIHCVAVGRQRVRLHTADLHEHLSVRQDSRGVKVTLLHDDPVPRVPRAVAGGLTYWAAWAHRPYDAKWLAHLARSKVMHILPQVESQPVNDVVRLSYWLASNLPASDSHRQSLLEASTVAERLRKVIQKVDELVHVTCKHCNCCFGAATDCMVMSESGVSGLFVNPHGYVHDMMFLRTARGYRLQGRPETEHSWFPGYAWTILNCRGCHEHIGWRFTAAIEIEPPVFWGIRRDAIEMSNTAELPQHGDNGDGHGGDDGGTDSDADEDDDDDDPGLSDWHNILLPFLAGITRGDDGPLLLTDGRDT